MNRPHQRFGGWGGIVIALVLIGVGGWYLLRNTLGIDLPELSGEAIWPIVVLALGIALLTNSLRTTDSVVPPTETSR